MSEATATTMPTHGKKEHLFVRVDDNRRGSMSECVRSQSYTRLAYKRCPVSDVRQENVINIKTTTPSTTTTTTTANKEQRQAVDAHTWLIRIQVRDNSFQNPIEWAYENNKATRFSMPHCKHCNTRFDVVVVVVAIAYMKRVTRSSEMAGHYFRQNAFGGELFIKCSLAIFRF